MFVFSSRRIGHTLFLLFLALFFCIPVKAGNIFFGMSIRGNTLTLTNQGNSTAFYPTMLRLQSDGQWVPLARAPGTPASVELLAGATTEFAWSDPRSGQEAFQLEKLRPVMVRFYDQAGSGFGQISFFNEPQAAPETLDARYVHGKMTITPPEFPTIRASWLLWPQENGIDPLRFPLSLDIAQPPARRIEWRSGMEPVKIDLGAGQPFAMLLHETGQGLMIQNVADGGLQGRQQRAAWLDAGRWFYWAADAIAVLAILAFIALSVVNLRARSAK